MFAEPAEEHLIVACVTISLKQNQEVAEALLEMITLQHTHPPNCKSLEEVSAPSAGYHSDQQPIV